MASNMFDSLVPAQASGPSPANMFDGLIPKKTEAEPTSLRDRALNSLPPDLREYAQKALSHLGGQQNAPSYSPLKPADPNNMPNDAINPVGTDAQMTAGLGATGALMRGLGSIPRPAQPPPPQAPQVDMSQMPTQQSFGAKMAQNTGGAPQPINPPALPQGGAPPPLPSVQAAGDAAQTGLLGQVARSVGGPIAHTAAGHLPFPFNIAAHAGIKMMNL